MKDFDSNITIIVPTYNAATTLSQLFNSLEQQKNQHYVREIIFINDHSLDNSLKIVKQYSRVSSYKITIIDHQATQGLAKNYNQGIRLSKTKYFILLHDDIVFENSDIFNKITYPFIDHPNVLCTYPQSKLPYSLFLSYNFWQKVLFSRHTGKEISYFCGKFDCYNKELMLKKLGYFNDRDFLTAGEDSDIQKRIKLNRLTIAKSDVKIIHIHSADPHYSFQKVLRKEAQMSETYGVIVRKYGLSSIAEVTLTLFRPLLILGLLTPYLNILALILIIIYAFAYTRLVYLTEYKNPLIITLPIINISFLFIGTFFTLRGYITGRQLIK